MKSTSSIGPPHANGGSMLQTTVERVTGHIAQPVEDSLAIEEPLEIQLTYGPAGARQTRSISVTMRTPGNDFDLAAGFLMTEESSRMQTTWSTLRMQESLQRGAELPQAMDALKAGSKHNTVRVDLARVFK